MRKIFLTHGYTALVDESDYKWLSKWHWWLDHNGYAVRQARIGGKKVHISMHAAINQTPTGSHTDHVNHDRLDNRRSNLRTVTYSENQHNRFAQQNNTSGYNGISWHKAAGKWAARIMVDGQRRSLGVFTDFADAVRARQKAEVEFWESVL